MPRGDGFGRPKASHRINRSQDADREMAPATRRTRPGVNARTGLVDADGQSRAGSRRGRWLPAHFRRVVGENAQGDSIKFKDLRGKSRVLEIGSARGRSRMAASAQTVYLSAGVALAFTHISGKDGAMKVSGQANVGPPKRSFILLKAGDSFVLTRAQIPGHPALCDEQGQIERPATISCKLPEIFADLKPKEPVWFDDGKIGGVIESVSAERVTVRITTTKPGGDKLGEDKGINFPQSAIRLPAMTKKDIAESRVRGEA
jgi:pyruvate kinase